MRCTFVGKRRVDYVAKKTGNHVLGWNLYCTHEDQQTEGLKTESFYVNDNFRITSQVGDVVDVFFNQYGSIESFQTVVE